MLGVGVLGDRVDGCEFFFSFPFVRGCECRMWSLQCGHC